MQQRTRQFFEYKMSVQQLAGAEAAVPRYTSYPTAPHFSPSAGAEHYSSWLESLTDADALSLYLHVPFCAQLCFYCGCNTKAVQKIAPVERYAEALIREIGLVAARAGRRRIVHLHWGGGTPSMLGPDRLRELAAELDTRFDLGAMREHAIELDPRHVDEALVEALIDIGVNRASLGVQDLSETVQQAIGRVQPYEIVERAAALLRGAGIASVNADLMYGLPGQTAQDVRRTIELAHRLNPQRLAIFGYAHVPWFKPHQKMIDAAALPGPVERLAQAAAAHETLTALGYRPIGLDHYALEDDSLAAAARAGHLRRNFQGYTSDDADVLIGLGTSAIGQLPQGFVQNAPDTAGYERAVSEGRFATVRGLVLSAEDRLRARIISDLMCHMACDFERVAQDLGAAALPSVTLDIEKLTPFVEEGLVRVDGGKVIVADSGRPYLRLIASVFDAYLGRTRARHSVAV